jgi:hypothetical protein
LMSHFRGDQLYSDRRCMLLPLKLYVWSHALLDGLIYVPLPRCLLLLFLHAHQILLEMRFIESGRWQEWRLLLLAYRQIFEGGGHLKVLHGQSIDGLT